jgi:hypothetical protein
MLTAVRSRAGLATAAQILPRAPRDGRNGPVRGRVRKNCGAGFVIDDPESSGKMVVLGCVRHQLALYIHAMIGRQPLFPPFVGISGSSPRGHPCRVLRSFCGTILRSLDAHFMVASTA